MSTRILRNTVTGRPIREDGQVVRTKPHVCGKHCPQHAPLIVLAEINQEGEAK